MARSGVYCFMRRFALLCLVTVMLTVVGVIIWYSSAPREVPFARFPVVTMLKERTGAEHVKFMRPLLYINFGDKRVEAELHNTRIHYPHATIVTAKTLRVSSPFDSIFSATRINGLHVEDLSVTLPDAAEPLHIPTIYINPRGSSMKETQVNVDLSNIADGAFLRGTIKLTQKNIDIDASYNTIPLSLAALFMQEAQGLSGMISGEARAKLTSDFHFVRAAVDAKSTTALQWKHETYYPNMPLTLDKVALRASISDKMDNVYLEQLSIMHKDAQLSVTGRALDGTFSSNLRVDTLPVGLVTALWPQTIATQARDWVKTRILQGELYNIHTNITGSFAALEKVKLKGSAQARRALVKYVPHLPPVRNVQAVLHVTQDSLDIDVTQGQSMTATIVQHADVTIPSFAKAAMPLKIALQLKGPAHDVATFISPQYLNKAAKLTLDPKTIRGDVDGVVKLSFPILPQRGGLAKPSSFDYLDVNIDASLHDMAQDGIMQQWNLRAFNGDVTLNNDVVTIKAGGLMQDVDTSLNATHYYSKGHNKTDYTISLLLPDHKFDTFNIPMPPGYIHGMVQLDADVKEYPDKVVTHATMDLRDAALSFAPLAWRKPVGEAAMLTMVETKRAGQRTIDDLSLKSASGSANGSLVFYPSGGLQNALLPQVDAPQLDGSVTFKIDPNGREFITVDAHSLTLPPSDDVDDAASSLPVSTAIPPGADLLQPLRERVFDVKAKKLHMSSGSFKNVTFTSDCNNVRCSSLLLRAGYGDRQELVASLSAFDEVSHTAEVRATNAGEALKMLDIYDKIGGGQLKISGTARDIFTMPRAHALVKSRMVTLADAPLLTKIMTLASLTGISDTITGNGIAFDSVRATVAVSDSIITIDSVSAKGDAMGIVASGTVGLTDYALNLDGTVMPSYALNSLPGKIPLVGELLVGGKDEGLFGARFSVDGTYKIPDVSVNPLSILTPGFTRNVFNLMSDDDE